jgi:DNA-binding NarL/FixJ family response regulator
MKMCCISPEAMTVRSGLKVLATERTANFHLGNAIQKLDCDNKHSAVIKAMRMGMIR